MQNKKIAFLVTSLNSGGIENYLLRYLNYDREIIPYVICKSGFSGELEMQYQKEIKSLTVIKYRIGYLNLLSWLHLYRIMKKEKINVICDFTGNFAGVPLLCAYFANIKRRIAFYRGSTNRFKETGLHLIYNNIMKMFVKVFATDILSNSYAALDFFFSRWKNNEKYKVIYNDISSDFFSICKSKENVREQLELPVHSFVIGHTGRYNWAKNHDTMIKVAIELCTRYSDIYFVFIGKDTELYLKKCIEEAGLLEQIRLLGLRKDVATLLKAFDVFYFPSITEGQPNALLEAMVSGLPIVASNILPIKECVPKRICRFLLPPTDVNIAVDRLESYYLDCNLMDDFKCKDWAIKNYASGKWFERFKKILKQ